jgi:[ribosomal protein S18]-alanine N-acetyltransferase
MATTQTLSDLTIRPMLAQDIEAIALIENSAYEAPWPKIAFFAVLEKAYPAFVMQKQNEIIGYVIATHVQNEAHILNFVIAPLMQHQGLGRKLLTFLLAVLPQIEKVSLEVACNNVPAIKLYESFGFKQQGLRKQYYQTSAGRIDALILVRNCDYT